MSKNIFKKGKLIVFDGTDGSGKATQVRVEKEKLADLGYVVKSLDFPRYDDNFFGSEIGKCLAGERGDWAGTHPKIASVLYAADRFESSRQIKQWLDDGCVVILDRYVSSNQIHQGGKINNQEERREFMQWLDTMEHKIFGIPRPDAIFYLDVPLIISQKLLMEKSNQESKKYLNGKIDQHEGDLEHLENAKQSGLKMIAENNNWIKIQCAPDNKLRSIDSIHTEIHSLVMEIINN